LRPLEINRPIIVLTGGPGGGKTTLIEELRRDPVWNERFLIVPEAIGYAGQVGMSVQERAFQRLMVETQAALETALQQTLAPDDPRCILCHRGTLDPLAYWLARGWPEGDFYAFTNTRLADHYSRYSAVLHLVTAADGAAVHYRSRPLAHRGETPEEAARLDRLLAHAWGDHPCYHRLGNGPGGWPAKAAKAKGILATVVDSRSPR
jgi:predicted ATPase